MPDRFISLAAAQFAAKRFAQLFKPARQASYHKWETCGWIRRREKEGPMRLVHVVIPKACSEPGHDNAVWQQAQKHLDSLELKLAAGDRGDTFPPDPESTLCRLLDRQGWEHAIILATAESWPARIVEHTGPRPYWAMLLWRLRAAETLMLRHGNVCAIDRSGSNEKLVPILNVEERTFFRLARTPYRPPWERFARPSAADWSAGMLPEWYPPGVRIYLPRMPGLSQPSHRSDRRRNRPHR